MKYKQLSFLLAVILTSTAPIFADKIPGDSKNESKGAISTQALTEKQGLHDLYTSGDSGLSGAKKNEVRSASSLESRFTHFTESERASGLGGMENAEGNSGKPPVTVVDFDSNDRDFSHMDRGKSHGKGNVNNPGGGSTTPALLAVSEPGSQLLLLIGLAGLGIFFLRRNSYQNANE